MRQPGHRTKLATALAAVVLSSGLCPLAAHASQPRRESPKPHIAWTLPASANANTPIGFSWTANKLPAGSHLAIQEPVGTAKVWRSIARLQNVKGSSTIPGLSLGQDYRYRLALLNHQGQLLAEIPRSIDIYGQVSLAKLAGNTADNTSGIYASPTSSFPFVYSLKAAFYGGLSATVFSVTPADNDCETVTLQFEVGSYSQAWPNEANVGATLTVVQETQNPVSEPASFNNVGTVTATLIPGQSWAINGSYTNTNGYDQAAQIYVSGFGICDSSRAIITAGDDLY
jgi:hypothetical protein